MLYQGLKLHSIDIINPAKECVYASILSILEKDLLMCLRILLMHLSNQSINLYSTLNEKMKTKSSADPNLRRSGKVHC